MNARHTKTKWLQTVAGMLFIVLGYSVLQAQVPDTAWTKTFGGTNLDVGLSVQQIADSGYVIAGWTRSFSAGAADVYVIKTDAWGDTIWTRHYGGVLDDQGLAIRQTANSGYVIAGWTASFGAGDRDVYVIRMDVFGDTIWTGTYGNVGCDQGCAVVPIANGEYAVAGSYSWWSQEDAALMRVASGGWPIWWHTYGGSEFDIGNAVQATSDNGYIVTGETRSLGPGTPDNPNLYMIKTNFSGDTIWTKVHGNWSSEIGYAVEETTTHGYIIAGTCADSLNGSCILLLKTDKYGDTVWVRKYWGLGQASGYAAVETADQGYLVAGESNNDLYLIKVNQSGDSLWAQAFGSSGYDEARAIMRTADDGYIIVGSTWSAANNRDVWLVKIEPDTFGIVEQDIVSPKKDLPVATIMSGSLSLVENKEYKIFDIMGCQIHTLHPAPGIYFIEVDSRIKQKIVLIE
ncbi:hypothetical protein JXB22_11530 [candidate division WOR-3 bacterium]|nr:hypothetical protein [candidate division WOR-3 bacterium]